MYRLIFPSFVLFFLGALSPVVSSQVNVEMLLPEGVSVGEVFDIPIIVDDGDRDLGSYALRLRYDPSLFGVISLSGGLVDGYRDAPVANIEGVAPGILDITANNVGLFVTPPSYEIARIKLEVIGPATSTAGISLRSSPGGGFYSVNGFRRLPVRFNQPEIRQILASTENRSYKPIADAGENMRSKLGDVVLLTAENSYDFDTAQADLYYEWHLISAPRKSQFSRASFGEPVSRDIEFQPDAPGVYRFRVIVSDGLSRSVDKISVKVD